MKKRIFFLLATLFVSIVQLKAQAGNLDNTFDNDGRVQISIGTNADVIHAMAIYPDGKILVAGSSKDVNNTYWDFSLARFNPNGSLDNTFSSDGKVITAFGPKDDSPNDVALQADGKIVVVGVTDNGTNNNVAVARYNTDGSLDETFGTLGELTFLFNPDKITEEGAHSVKIQPDGKIVVAGFSGHTSYSDFALARLLPNGSFDTSFGNGGLVLTDIDFFTIDAIQEITLQPDGKIVAAGNIATGSIAIARYNPDGSLDTGFGEQGTFSTKLGTFFDDASANSVVLQADGKIVTGGNFNGDFMVARFTTEGSLDSLFGIGGKQIVHFGDYSDALRSMVLQHDGKILVGGYVGGSLSSFSFALARYHSDGRIDSTFHADGKVSTSFLGSSSISQVYSVAIQPDGKIVAAGAYGTGTETNYAMARYLSSDQVKTNDLYGSIVSATVYPNPATSNAMLDYHLKCADQVSIYLTSGDGLILETLLEKVKLAEGRHQQKISFPEDLPNGPYLIVLLTSGGQVVIKTTKL